MIFDFGSGADFVPAMRYSCYAFECFPDNWSHYWDCVLSVYAVVLPYRRWRRMKIDLVAVAAAAVDAVMMVPVGT